MQIFNNSHTYVNQNYSHLLLSTDIIRTFMVVLDLPLKEE